MNIDYNSLDSLKEKVNSITNSVNNKLSSISDNNNIFKKINFNYVVYGSIVIVTAGVLGISKPMIILSKDNNNNYYVNGFKFLFALLLLSIILIMFVRSILTKKFI